LHKEACKINRDVDQDVRYMNYSMFCQEAVEGFYVDDELVGFARWHRITYHLSNIYVSEQARGMGLARRFINERQLRTLYVIPHNHLAKRLYASLGFVQAHCSVPTREFMTREHLLQRA